MHLSDGVIGLGQCGIGYAGAVGLLALAQYRLKQAEIPKISLMSAAFFVSSLAHIKLGMTSVHLSLIGLMGIVLGLRAPVGIFTGLLFQAIMFGHGGVSTLGLNTLIFSIPALGVHGLLRLLKGLVKGVFARSLLAAGAAFLGIFGGSILVFLVIISGGQAFTGLGIVFSSANLILGFIEAGLTFLIVRQLLVLKPDLLEVTFGR